MDTELMGILLVKSDSKGDRLLFKYPYVSGVELNAVDKLKKNPYALLVTEDSLYGPPITDDKEEGQLSAFSDDALTALFAVKPDLSGYKFEIKVNGIRFVSHPRSIETWVKTESTKETKKPKKKQRRIVSSPTYILVNVVFAVKALTDYSLVKCYHDLSKRIGICIRHEEKRCGYFVDQMKLMMNEHDMITTRADNVIMEELESNPFDDILKKSSLARDLKFMYESLSSQGSVCLRINNWVELKFCIPQRVHSIDRCSLIIYPEDIERCLQNMKPYHGLLLLKDVLQILHSLSPDTSPSLIRLIKTYSPIKNFQTLACDADLTLAQVFNLTGHLLYWGKAIVIYPLCENNVYVVAPCANISSTKLNDEFSEIFPDHRLHEVLSEFSLPTIMSQKLNPLTHSDERIELVQIVTWMLQHRLIMQLHTYVYFMPTKNGLSTLYPTEVNEERTALLKVPASSVPEDFHLLIRLLKQGYLLGSHHIEEIMYLENIRRNQLIRILEKFGDILVTSEAEDPAVCLFYPNLRDVRICNTV